jgi:NitT/TauT family transport system substrate-binding protein
MKISKPLAIVIVAIVIIAVAGVAVLATQNNKPESETVRVGYLAGDLHQLSRVVMMNTTVFGGTSLLEKYGVNAVAGSAGGYAAGGAVMDAFAANAIDIAWLGSPPAIQKALNAGTDIKIIAVANNEGSSVVAKIGINNVTDLDQKTVATPGPSSIQHLLFLEIAKEAGLNVIQKGVTDLTPNTVQWVQIAPKDQESALANNQVDAAIGWEPYGSEAILSGTAHIIEWSGEVWPDHPCCVIAVKTSFAEAHPDIVAKVLKAHIEANAWIANSTADPSSNNYTQLVNMASVFAFGKSADEASTQIVASALNHTKFTYEMTDAFKASLVNFTKSYISLKLISDNMLSERGYSSEDDFINHLVDTSYLESAKSVQSV